MILLAGLGNPGGKYDATRHNIGFHVIDTLAANHHTEVNQKKFNSLYGEIRIGTEKVILIKPQTYMNRSGDSVGAWMRYFDLPEENLLVIYDDMDFAPGEIKLRAKGSGGTHNGMKSIIQHLGNSDFPRLRMGIGKPLWQSAAQYVLSRFTPEEIPVMQKAVKEGAEAAETFVREGIQIAMNRYNTKKEIKETKEKVQEPKQETEQETVNEG